MCSKTVLLSTHAQKLNGHRYFWTLTAMLLNVNANWPLKFLNAKLNWTGFFLRTRVQAWISVIWYHCVSDIYPLWVHVDVDRPVPLLKPKTQKSKKNNQILSKNYLFTCQAVPCLPPPAPAISLFLTAGPTAVRRCPARGTRNRGVSWEENNFHTLTVILFVYFFS